MIQYVAQRLMELGREVVLIEDEGLALWSYVESDPLR